jgi:hypothetical protein
MKSIALTNLSRRSSQTDSSKAEEKEGLEKIHDDRNY